MDTVGQNALFCIYNITFGDAYHGSHPLGKLKMPVEFDLPAVKANFDQYIKKIGDLLTSGPEMDRYANFKAELSQRRSDDGFGEA